jgi:hypothetical protein
MTKVKTKLECLKCKNFFSAKGGNYHNHVSVCNGSYTPFVKLVCCKFCDKDFSLMSTSERANHTRWCVKNPKRNEYSKNLSKARVARKNIKNQYSYGAVCSKETKEKIRSASTGRTHTEETKKKISEIALQQTHRRLQRCIIEYKGVMLDSTWELALAKRLDYLEVKWIRPEPIKWIDKNGITHNYFADFYLIDYNLFLDPKNPHAINVQKEKLKCLLNQYKNIIILDSLERCENFTI